MFGPATRNADREVLDVIVENAAPGPAVAGRQLDLNETQFSTEPMRDGSVASQWSHDAPRRRRIYELTPAGATALAAKRREWRLFAKAVELVQNPPTPTSRMVLT